MKFSSLNIQYVSRGGRWTGPRQSVHQGSESVPGRVRQSKNLGDVTGSPGIDLYGLFFLYHNRLQRLPRRVRRALAKKVGASLAGAALLLALSARDLFAATFTASNAAELIVAIHSANNEFSNPGADTIQLTDDVVLIAIDNDIQQPTGLPAVSSEITIEGNGHIIERDNRAQEFRILIVEITGDLTLNEATVSGGVALGGGVIFNDEGNLTLERTTVSGGSANGGGGILNDKGVVVIMNSTVAGNSGSFGGGVYTLGGSVSITNSTVSDNWAKVGAGVDLTFGSTVSITNSTVYANSARVGGGVACEDGNVMITNSTIADNTAEYGGGVYRGVSGCDEVNVVNTILADNLADVSGDNCDGDPVTSLGHNLADDETCSPNGTTDRTPATFPGLTLGLGAFVDGAPGAGHLPILLGSHAINAADPGTCPPMDQLGRQRVGICDIGAVEFSNTGAITLNFSVEMPAAPREFINAMPVPDELQEFAPSFQNVARAEISLAFDPNQPDIDPDPNVGHIRIGTLSVEIPAIGGLISQSSDNMQISVFNDTSNPDDQFFAAVFSVDSFSNDAGLPTPEFVSVQFTGNTSMLDSDLIPTTPPNWISGGLSFNFRASDNTRRQVLLAIRPISGIDTDGDSLLDSWETEGIDTDGDGAIDLDLPAMGANPMRKDVFVELDYMASKGFCFLGSCFGGHSHKPKLSALETIIEAFASAPVSNPDGSNGINMHIDAGPDTIMNPVTGELWGAMSRSDELRHRNELGHLSGFMYDWTEFDAIKNGNGVPGKFTPERHAVFHYGIFAHDLGGSVRSASPALGIVRFPEARRLQEAVELLVLHCWSDQAPLDSSKAS